MFNLENTSGVRDVAAKIMKSLEICQLDTLSSTIHEIRCLLENEFDIKFFSIVVFTLEDYTPL